VMEEVAAAVPAGANGLLGVFANIMNVKRWVQAAPSFLGFNVDDPALTGRAACIRAIEEQAAFASRGHLSIIEELTGRKFSELVFTGGAAKGELWPHIVADVLGLPVRVPQVKESTALGAAMFAAVGVGIYSNIEEVAERVVRFERTVEPDQSNSGVYDDVYERWAQVYPQVLALSERTLLAPMWWPAGADAQEPVAVG